MLDRTAIALSSSAWCLKEISCNSVDSHWFIHCLFDHENIAYFNWSLDGSDSYGNHTEDDFSCDVTCDRGDWGHCHVWYLIIFNDIQSHKALLLSNTLHRALQRSIACKSSCLFLSSCSLQYSLHSYEFITDQFRYIKIQPNTINLSPRLWGKNPTNSVVNILQNLIPAP